MVGLHSVAIITPGAGVETGRNLVTNPSLETATTGWTASRGTVTRAAIPHPVAGAWGGQFVSTVGTVAQGNYTALPLMPTTPGTHSAAVYLEPFGAAIGLSFRLWITWNDAGGAQVGQYFAPAVVVDGGAMVRLVATTSNAPATTTQARLFVQAMEPVPVGAGWYWDAAQLLRADEPGAYWDGDTTDTPVTAYAWAGTAHASASVRTSFLAADLSCLVDSVSLNHGRDDSGSQPDASSATISLTVDATTDTLPAAVEVGATVHVTTQTTSGAHDRFVGRITDLALGWDDAGADTPDAGVGQIVAVSSLADLGRRVVGDVPWPQELDGARVARVMAAAGITLDPAFSDPGTVQLLPRDVDASQALDVAQAAAVDGAGVLWQTRAGQVRYADAAHRRGVLASLALDACDLLVTPTWRRTLEGLVNSVSIGYGAEPPEGGEQARYVASNPASVTQWGTYAYSTTTELAALADAQAQGDLLLARNSAPVWIMAALPVDVAGLDAAQYDALLELDMHSLLSLTGLPGLGAAPTSANLWVEGWKEELTYGTHQLELVVSGYCRTVPPPRWDDVAPSWTWGTTTELRRNLVGNPSAETDTAGWAAAGAGTTISANPLTSAPAGAQILRATLGTASFSGAAYDIPAAPGDVFGLRVMLRTPDYSDPVYLRYQFLDDAGAQLATNSTGAVASPVTDWVEFQRTTAAAPAGTATLRIQAFRQVANATTGHRLFIDGALVTKLPAGGTFDRTYFDGDTPDTATRHYAWVGAAHDSASTEGAPIVGGLPPELTWDAAACLGPPVNLGRWNDQPATLRWDQLAPAITWDTYPNQ